MRTVFARLHELDPEEEEQKLSDTGDAEGGEVKMSVSGSVAQTQHAAQAQQSSVEQDVDVNETPPLQDASIVAEQPPETASIPRLPCTSF